MHRIPSSSTTAVSMGLTPTSWTSFARSCQCRYQASQSIKVILNPYSSPKPRPNQADGAEAAAAEAQAGKAAAEATEAEAAEAEAVSGLPEENTFAAKLARELAAAKHATEREQAEQVAELRNAMLQKKMERSAAA